MVSENKRRWLIVVICAAVLILVLVEDGLRVDYEKSIPTFKAYVLILVLVEDGLREESWAIDGKRLQS